jgi:hypothetical protein
MLYQGYVYVAPRDYNNVHMFLGMLNSCYVYVACIAVYIYLIFILFGIRYYYSNIIRKGVLTICNTIHIVYVTYNYKM